VLRRVKATAAGDVLTVRMISGQIPDDYSKVAERFVHTFGARACRVVPGRRPELVVVTLRRRDVLTRIVRPLPMVSAPDFAALPIGLDEDGNVYGLRLLGTQVLVVGSTGSGKGSVIWSLVRALAGGVASGLVRLWAFDPKGGMELGGGASLFARFSCDDYPGMADSLDEAVAITRARAARLRGHSRQHEPTVADPLVVIVVDELAALTAYCPDRKLRDRIRDALAVILTQGRAVAVHVIAAIQDPRKEIIPFRNLFPTRIGLRLAEPSEVDLVLGDGARNRGALCDRIPQHQPGVGFVVLDGDPVPTRVRFSYLTDADITELAQTYGRLHVNEGQVVEEPRGWAA
jgi:S-DNA-T family DNA segregation ATPase FtsK/SpoIIIE